MAKNIDPTYSNETAAHRSTDAKPGHARVRTHKKRNEKKLKSSCSGTGLNERSGLDDFLEIT
jgi:hypothetical protein